MSRFTGEEKLIARTAAFKREIIRINDQVYFATGYGGSNATLIIGEESCILVDALNGCQVAKEALADFRRITDKPIKTLIYTHYHHFDHTGGAGALVDDDCEIIARTASFPQLGRSQLVSDVFARRSARQFGVGLTPEEVVSIGIGPLNDVNSQKCMRKPKRFFTEERLELAIDGVDIVLAAAPGETDDQLFVWLPQWEILCCGDNYYASWPNLYAIRGGQYRDVDSWVRVLEAMQAQNAQVLLPGHTEPIIGREAVKQTLGNYHDAICYVLEETLKGMNAGKSADELAAEIELPEAWRDLQYLQEYYGTVSGAVRSIFSGYMGWFDGNPTDLDPTPPALKAQKTIQAMGGADKVYALAESALAEEDEQWACELCDLLLDAGERADDARPLKGQALALIARKQTSANYRHYYIACSKELLGSAPQATLTAASQDIAKK